MKNDTTFRNKSFNPFAGWYFFTFLTGDFKQLNITLDSLNSNPHVLKHKKESKIPLTYRIALVVEEVSVMATGANLEEVPKHEKDTKVRN